MKFEKITDTKIKIILSLRDMELNNVSAESIFSNSASSQRLLQNMLKRAKLDDREIEVLILRFGLCGCESQSCEKLSKL